MKEIKEKILELKNFEKGEIKGVRTPTHYTIFFENVEVFNIKFCWISKSDNLFEIEDGYFLKKDISADIKPLQEAIIEILNTDWLEYSALIDE